MLPKGWKLRTVGELFDVQLGKMLNQAATEQTPQFKYLGNTNVKWGYFDILGLKTMYFSKKEREKFALQYGDIVMCEGGEVGRCAIWRYGTKDIFYQKALHRLRPKGNIIPEFFQNYMDYIAGTKLLDDFTTRTSIAHLTREKLLELPVKTPPLPEQQKIAQILSTWDKAIEKLEALIAGKRNRKKALMQQILTGKKRFAGFEGEWKPARLMKLLQEEKARNKDCSITRVLSVTNRSGFVLPEEQFSRQVASSNLSNYKIVRKGQFGYNPSRINVGSFARLDSYDVGVLSPMYVVFSIDDSKLNSDFFLNWMGSHEAKQRIISSTQGTVRDSVGFDALSSFHIKLPTVEEQQKIASVLSTADTEIQIHQKQLSALKEQKKGLMQQLLTGKKRVKLDEPELLAEAAGA